MSRNQRGNPRQLHHTLGHPSEIESPGGVIDGQVAYNVWQLRIAKNRIRCRPPGILAYAAKQRTTMFTAEIYSGKLV